MAVALRHSDCSNAAALPHITQLFHVALKVTTACQACYRSTPAMQHCRDLDTMSAFILSKFMWEVAPCTLVHIIW